MKGDVEDPLAFGQAVRFDEEEGAIVLPDGVIVPEPIGGAS